jgi:hypothetical protein
MYCWIDLMGGFEFRLAIILTRIGKDETDF